MLYWVARSAAELREAAGRKMVHIAASADVTESTISRFEKALSWPHQADRLIAAYANDLDVDVFDIWRRAFELWSAKRKPRPPKQRRSND